MKCTWRLHHTKSYSSGKSTLPEPYPNWKSPSELLIFLHPPDFLCHLKDKVPTVNISVLQINCYIVIKESNIPENVMLLNIYAYNNTASKSIRQTLVRLRREIYKSTIMTGNFLFPV